MHLVPRAITGQLVVHFDVFTPESIARSIHLQAAGGQNDSCNDMSKVSLATMSAFADLLYRGLGRSAAGKLASRAAMLSA